MAALREARATSLALLRGAYCPPAAKNTLESTGDDDGDWPVEGTQETQEFLKEFVFEMKIGKNLKEFLCTESAQEADTQENLETEWDAVAERTDILRLERQANFGKIAPKEDSSSSLISYTEVQTWVSQLCADAELELLSAQKKLQPLSENHGLRNAASLLRRSAKPSDRQRRRGKDLVMHLRIVPFDFNTPVHFRMLRTVYTKLTLNKWCPSIGNHWEVLGFQAGDPRTDLNRSGGVLNVLHLFFFIAHHFELAKSCFQLSLDDQQNFPFACISINMTALVIEALSAGRLSSLCNKETGDQGVLELTCRLHSAGLAYFCSRWRAQKRTILHTEQTKNEIKALLDRKPAKLLEEMTQAASLHAKKLAAPAKFADLETIAAAAQAPSVNKNRGLWARSKAAVLPKRLRQYQDENFCA